MIAAIILPLLIALFSPVNTLAGEKVDGPEISCEIRFSQLDPDGGVLRGFKQDFKEVATADACLRFCTQQLTNESFRPLECAYSKFEGEKLVRTVLDLKERDTKKRQICVSGEMVRSCRGTRLKSFKLGDLNKEDCRARCAAKDENESCRWGSELISFECSPVPTKRSQIFTSFSDRPKTDYFDCKSPWVGVFKDDLPGRLLEISPWDPTCKRKVEDLFLTFDGKVVGRIPKAEIVATDPWKLKESFRFVPPIKNAGPFTGAGFIVTTNSKFSDPDHWKVSKANDDVIQRASKVLATTTSVLIGRIEQEKECASGKRPPESPQDYFNWNVASSDLVFSKSYRNKRGDYLIGMTVKKSAVVLPRGYSFCPSCVADPVIQGQRARETTNVQWVFIPKDNEPVVLGSFKPEDAGDYDGDGDSEFIFYSDPVEIPSRASLLIFDHTFERAFEADATQL